MDEVKKRRWSHRWMSVMTWNCNPLPAHILLDASPNSRFSDYFQLPLCVFKRLHKISTAFKADVFVSSLTVEGSEVDSRFLNHCTDLLCVALLRLSLRSKGVTLNEVTGMQVDPWCVYMFLMAFNLFLTYTSLFCSSVPKVRSWISERVSCQVWFEPVVRVKVKEQKTKMICALKSCNITMKCSINKGYLTGFPQVKCADFFLTFTDLKDEFPFQTDTVF